MGYMDGCTFCHDPSDIPDGEHWVILIGRSITIPGDERSRTHPGHGYPESTESHLEYRAYTDKKLFEAAVKALVEDNNKSYSKTSFKAVHVAESVKPRVTVSVDL